MYNPSNAGEVDYQLRLVEYLDCMYDDTTILLKITVEAPRFTMPIGEKYFITDFPRWVEDCSNEHRYQFQVYPHRGGGMSICYTFLEEFNIYPIVERAIHYVPFRREVWEELESSVVYMVMSPWLYMYKVRDYYICNDRVRENMEMIETQEFIWFTVSIVLHTAKNGLSYHR